MTKGSDEGLTLETPAFQIRYYNCKSYMKILKEIKSLVVGFFLVFQFSVEFEPRSGVERN